MWIATKNKIECNAVVAMCGCACVFMRTRLLVCLHVPVGTKVTDMRVCMCVCECVCVHAHGSVRLSVPMHSRLCVHALRVVRKYKTTTGITPVNLHKQRHLKFSDLSLHFTSTTKVRQKDGEFYKCQYRNLTLLWTDTSLICSTISVIVLNSFDHFKIIL